MLLKHVFGCRQRVLHAGFGQYNENLPHAAGIENAVHGGHAQVDLQYTNSEMSQK